MHRGATLMEVLVSMMILAIGIISLATLFPIAVMHTVKAHQLTIGTNHAKNAEAMIDVIPEMIYDPGYGSDPEFPTPSAYRGRNYRVDPLGVVNELPDPLGQLRRLSGLDPQMPPEWRRQRADFLATSPDSWIDIYGGAVLGHTVPTSDAPHIEWIDLDGFSASGVTVPNPIPRFPSMRVVCYFTARSGGVDAVWGTIDPSGTAGDRIHFESLGLAVPPGTLLERAVVQSQDRRVTWFLTVRHSRSGIANVDVAVFFNRSLEAADEVVVDADFQAGRSRVALSWSGVSPFIKKGSYVLDTQNGHWYQIVDFTEDANSADVVLATPARASSRDNAGSAALFRGLVEVYPLGTVR